MSRSGNLWVVDIDNARLTEISADGAIAREIPLRHLPARPGGIVELSDRLMIVSEIVPGQNVIEVEPETFAVQSIRPFPWPEELDISYRIGVRIAHHPTEPDTWAAGFRQGPGFMVWRHGRAASYRLLDRVLFGPRR